LKLITNLFLSLFLLFASVIFSQENIEFQQLIGENVSTQSITYAIKQDSIGNVWIASEEGVLKHNSKYYKVYNTYNGLPESVSNRTTQLFIDSKQRIWIGLENGVCLYDEIFDKFNLITNKTDINPSLVTTITEDSNGVIWIGGFNGLWKYDSNVPNSAITQVLNDHSIEALYSINDHIIFGTSKGLFVYDSKDENFVEIKLNTHSKNISALGKYNGNILIGTKTGGVFEMNSSFSDIKQLDFKKIITNKIKDFAVDSSNKLYIATDGDGIFYVNNNYEIINHFEEDVDNPKSLSSNGVYDIEIGHQGILWVATYGGGINFYNANKLPFQKIQHQINNTNSIVSNFTRAIAIDKNENLWFGTKKGVSIWNTKKNKWKHISTSSEDKNKKQDIVMALEPDNNFMWVGTYNNGFYRININNFKPVHYNLNTSKSLVKKVYSIFKDNKGNIWLGGIEGDLTVIRPNSKIDTYPIQQIQSITKSNSNKILVTGRDGVYSIDDKLKEFKLIEYLKPNKKTLAYSTVNSIYQTDDNRLILATNGAGLVFYNPKDQNIKRLTLNSGMPSDIIQGIVANNDSDIWASTTKGLAHITITSKDTIINVFNKRDGLASTEYNYGSYAKLNSQLFAFGGVDGVTLFNPIKIKGTNLKPTITFDEFKLFNKVVKPETSKFLKKHINITEKIKLRSNENTIEIKFTGILHGSSSQIKYIWKLDGFDDNWSEPSLNNFATYTNLNSGNYTFKVKAANKNGSYGEERFLNITIDSPWYATNKAFLLYALLVLGMIYLIIHFTSVVINKKNADEQIDFFNNITHEIKTPLAILISSLDRTTENIKSNDKSKERIKTTVKRINSLFEQMLNFHRITSQNNLNQDVSKIDLSKHINQRVLNFQPLTADRNLEIIVNNDWSDEVFYHDKDIFDKILLNLISNAIKYSFDSGKIYINTYKTKQGNLKIEFIDSGLGIPKDQQKYILNRYYRARNVINSQKPGTGLGLVMVKKIIEKTGGSISFISEENKGTTFTILLKNLIKEYNKQAISTENTISEIENQLEDFTELDEFSDSKILVVEDNDELREVLVNTLGVYFQMYEATNGVEGLETAKQVFPDIILTDLIMPEMDGMQMSKKIKEDINLNHIPVFMLTVLQNSAQKLESIETGIAAYLEKPIDMKFLLAKIINTLKYHRKLREKYIHENDTDSAILYRNKNDQEFLKNLEKNIIKNIENNSFSVLSLSENFGMSRTSLYMKLKNLVDLSPQDFIIHTKLKHSKKLLIKGELSIKEVAYSSGFSNPKYFSTSFKKFYGMTPSSFLESLK